MTILLFLFIILLIISLVISSKEINSYIQFLLTKYSSKKNNNNEFPQNRRIRLENNGNSRDIMLRDTNEFRNERFRRIKKKKKIESIKSTNLNENILNFKNSSEKINEIKYFEYKKINTNIER